MYTTIWYFGSLLIRWYHGCCSESCQGIEKRPKVCCPFSRWSEELHDEISQWWVVCRKRFHRIRERTEIMVRLRILRCFFLNKILRAFCIIIGFRNSLIRDGLIQIFIFLCYVDVNLTRTSYDMIMWYLSTKMTFLCPWNINVHEILMIYRRDLPRFHKFYAYVLTHLDCKRCNKECFTFLNLKIQVLLPCFY